MIFDSLYIIQSQVISLGKLPFLDKKILRSHFAPIFASEDCFINMRRSILHDDYPPEAIPLPSKPFIKNMGQVVFDTRSVRLAGYTGDFPKFMPGGCDGIILAENLAHCENYRDPKSKPQKNFKGYKPTAFGYNRKIKDQRMNFLYFETRHPLYIRGLSDSQTVADGHIYLHFFPSGYLVFNINISIKEKSQGSLEAVKTAFQETQPWRFDNEWVWQSKLGKMKLPELVRTIKENISRSIYRDDTETFGRESDWHYMVKAVTEEDASQVASALSLQSQTRLEFWNNMHVLLATKKGAVCRLYPSHTQKSAMRFFRKIFVMHEFVLLKNQIYTDYTEFLRPEIAKLKKFRLSTRHKIMEDDLFKFTVYNNQIPQYLMFLDKHIRSVSAYYRRIYSFFSTNYGFDERREKVKDLVGVWEGEVEKWEPPLQTLWDRVLKPLQSLITKFPF
ncbi:hypothetical protein KQH61_04980 [bacterium]|nr:hypothetical protein [bacterium]MCB2179255.1 hypothetical protein [bacterium]